MSVERVVGAAESALGVNYVWGGNSLRAGVDCSGLVQLAFLSAGIVLPRVSNMQANTGQKVGLDQMQPGDLIWWDNSSRNRGADHIAIYVGNGMMIEAPGRGKQVRVVPVAGRNPSGASRVLGVVAPTRDVWGMQVQLGPNADRRYTTAAVNGTGGPGPTETPNPAGAPGTAGLPVGEAGGLGDDLPPDSTPEQIEEYIRKNYSDVAWLLSNQEIRGILLRPDIDNLDPREIQSLIEGTDYWKTHSARSREYDRLLAEDPQRVTEMNRDALRLVDQVAGQAGLSLTPQQRTNLARNIVREGWDEADVNQYVVGAQRQNNIPAELRDGKYIDTRTGRLAYYGPNGEAGTATEAGARSHAKAGQTVKSHKMPDGRTAWYIVGEHVQSRGLAPGEASNTADTLIAHARRYGVPLTRASAESWSLRIQEGTANPEAFQGWLTSTAKGRWDQDPQVLSFIEGGGEVSDYFSSHAQVIADLLELNPDAVDIVNDPKFMEVTQFFDGKQRRSMTLREASDWARKRPEYAQTRAYKSTEAQLGMRMADFFGQVPG